MARGGHLKAIGRSPYGTDLAVAIQVVKPLLRYLGRGEKHQCRVRRDDLEVPVLVQLANGLADRSRPLPAPDDFRFDDHRRLHHT